MNLETQTIRCESASPEEIVSEIAAAFGDTPLAMTLFFASPRVPFTRLAQLMHDQIPGPWIGCTTAGEICGETGHCENSVVVMGIRSDAIEFRSKLIQQASSLTTIRAEAELSTLAMPASADESRKSFGLVLIDGLSRAEERVAGALAHALKDIPFAGGSAGDDLRFEETFVACDGVVAQDAAVVSVAETALPFQIFHTHHFERTPETLVITDAVPSERRVREINGRPAAEGYAEAIGMRVEDLSPDIFAAHPVLLTVGGAPFVRSIQKMDEDGSLVFFCAIEEGLVLRVARAKQLTAELADELTRISETMEPAAIIAFDCVLRRLEILSKGLRDDVSSMLRGVPVVGFSTYGEQYNGLHVNQTLTGVAIGRAA